VPCQERPGATGELLCHGLIQRNYGRLGNLVAVRVQPVVEFHLTLTEDCPSIVRAAVPGCTGTVAQRQRQPPETERSSSATT
jgi:hypothetical protein